jgi:hypothetical protein
MMIPSGRALAMGFGAAALGGRAGLGATSLGGCADGHPPRGWPDVVIIKSRDARGSS